MLKYIAEHTIKSLILKKNKGSKKKFLNWEEIQTIALVIEEEEKTSKHHLDALLDQFKKHFEVFYLELSAKLPTYSDWNCFTKKDKNLLGLPKKSILHSFKSKKYDLVINTASHSIFYSAGISSSLQCLCTCSSSDKFGHSELVIQRTRNQNLDDYLQEVVRYLKMINAKKTQLL